MYSKRNLEQKKTKCLHTTYVVSFEYLFYS